VSLWVGLRAKVGTEAEEAPFNGLKRLECC